MYARRSRLQELRHDKLTRAVDASKTFANQSSEFLKISRNSDSKFLQKRLKEELKEQEIVEALEKQQESIKRKAQFLQNEKLIANQQQKVLRERYLDEKLRQQVRESNQELRELETKLRSCYVAKGLAAQKAEREVLILQEKLFTKKENESMEQARLKEVEKMQEERDQAKERQKQLRNDLRDQIISSHHQNAKLYEEFLREKYYLDEIVRIVHEEHLQSLQKRVELKATTKKEMEEFRKAKEVWQKQQKFEIQMENERIKEYCEAREQKIMEEDLRRKELEKNRESLNEKMVAELSDLMEKKKKRENLLQELHAFEMNEKHEEKIRESLENQFRRRIQTRLSLEQQLQEQYKQKLREEQDERLFREDQMRLLAERDKLEQLSNEKKRRKLAEHRKAIQEILEDRKARQAVEMSKELKRRELEVQEEDKKQMIIEEERIKLLKEHAQVLLGFLPRGILRDSDRKHLPVIPLSTDINFI